MEGHAVFIKICLHIAMIFLYNTLNTFQSIAMPKVVLLCCCKFSCFVRIWVLIAGVYHRKHGEGGIFIIGDTQINIGI